MKLKLNVLLAILVGVVLVMGCSWRGRLNFYDPNDIGYDDVEDEDYTKYGVTLVFCNLEYAFEDEYIYFFDQDDKFFDIYHIHHNVRETTTYTKDYYVKSETLGEDIQANVNLKDGEKAIIYVDYLEKTMRVETMPEEEELELNSNINKIVNLTFNNSNSIEEQDIIILYVKGGDYIDSFYVSNTDTNYTVEISVDEFTIYSSLVGDKDIKLDSSQEIDVTIDYLEKTINVVGE